MVNRIETGRAAVNTASERLDYAGMQARLQLSCKDQIWAAIKKEVALGLGSRDLALGIAGFVTTIITTMVMNFFREEDRKGLALRIMVEARDMLEATDWTDATWNKEKGK